MNKRSRWALLAGMALVATVVMPVPASANHPFLTPQPPAITLDPGVPAGSAVKAIISSGETYHDFVFEGIPDGIGIAPGEADGTVDVFVAHEQSRVPFRGRADFVDSSVSKLTILTTPGPNMGAIVGAEVAISSDEGYIRFCSAFMAGPREGFKKWTFFTGEESNDILDVPKGAPYKGDKQSLGKDKRQAGFVVSLEAKNGKVRTIEEMGRHNHENTIVVPGGWSGKDKYALLSTDDTFNAPSSQLYLFTAKHENHARKGKGKLWAFRATSKNGTAVDPTDPFNSANDYLDIGTTDVLTGEFIEVPKDIAKGDTAENPQDALENWSNANNVFQFIRLEDLAYDRHNPRVVYVADTGATRVVPDPATGRLMRGPGGTVGQADNGRIFRFELNADDPKIVDGLTVFADGDAPGDPKFVPMRAPDNMDTSANSLMVQEDIGNAQIWRYDFTTTTWSVVATVNDPVGESSGIVDASGWFGEGWWMLDVQAHGSNVSEEVIDGVTFKREDGQLLLMRIPGS